MKAMVLNKTRPAEEWPLAEAAIEAPEPGAGEVRVRVRACGVCHTDLHTVEGDLAIPRLPLVPGHQIVGVVDAAGEGVTGLKIGDRVGVPWMHDTCRLCDHCGAGRENLCDEARFTGLHVNGGFAEYAIAAEQFAFLLPEGFSNEQAAPLLCAGIIGYRALRISGIEPGQRLGLWGFGASAHVAIQIARHWGCAAYVVTRSPEHREHALSLGAAWVGGPHDDPPELLDAAVNFTPAGSTVPHCLKALRKGGALALAGIHMSALPSMDYALLYGERSIRSVANSTRRDAVKLLELAVEIPIRTDVEIFPLEQANEVLIRLKQSQIRGAAVLRIGAE
jgi:propanol-preferring alcohol dehydrogenase